MVNVICSKEKKLSPKEGLDASIRNQLNELHYQISARNNICTNEENKMPFTPYGRALFSILEELTGSIISKDYLLEKVDLMFEDE